MKSRSSSFSIHVESKWIAKNVKELLDKGVPPSEIIVLVQRKKGAPIILNALKAAGVPAKSYYEESQLETDEAQMRFAAFKLMLNKNDRVAFRYLLGIGSQNFRANPYGSCERIAKIRGKRLSMRWKRCQPVQSNTRTLKR